MSQAIPVWFALRGHPARTCRVGWALELISYAIDAPTLPFAARIDECAWTENQVPDPSSRSRRTHHAGQRSDEARAREAVRRSTPSVIAQGYGRASWTMTAGARELILDGASISPNAHLPRTAGTYADLQRLAVGAPDHVLPVGG